MKKPSPQVNRYLIFGESENDTKSIKELLLWLNPGLDRRVSTMKGPPSLTRDARQAAVEKWIANIQSVVDVQEKSGNRVSAVLVHRDADGPDPEHSVAKKLGRDLSVLTCPGHPVVPVQMTEAWWFLFPEAVEKVNEVWRNKMSRTARNVDMINNPKEELFRITRATKRSYSEADSPAIAQKIRLLNAEPLGTSKSFDLFHTLAKDIA